MAAEFQPEEILAVLDRHDVTYVLISGYAALLHGSTLPTTDIDITSRRDRGNLAKLVAALGELDGRIRVSNDVEPLQFQTSPESLSSATVFNLATRFGDLDSCVAPKGPRRRSIGQQWRCPATLFASTVGSALATYSQP